MSLTPALSILSPIPFALLFCGRILIAQAFFDFLQLFLPKFVRKFLHPAREWWQVVLPVAHSYRTVARGDRRHQGSAMRSVAGEALSPKVSLM